MGEGDRGRDGPEGLGKGEWEGERGSVCIGYVGVVGADGGRDGGSEWENIAQNI